ncbi:MAG: hypothetical protein KF788_09105 [Piscinibacter sp.]|nr:hypothetical protein [Piscinibacter sp.]
MDDRFEHLGHDMRVRTPALRDGRFIWLYTVDDRWLTTSGGDYPNQSTALLAGRQAALAHVERFAETAHAEP